MENAGVSAEEDRGGVLGGWESEVPGCEGSVQAGFMLM